MRNPNEVYDFVPKIDITNFLSKLPINQEGEVSFRIQHQARYEIEWVEEDPPNKPEMDVRNPQGFLFGETELDDPQIGNFWEMGRARALVIQHDKVVASPPVGNQGYEYENFEVELEYLGSEPAQVLWSRVDSEPGSGVLVDENQTGGRFLNPTIGGLYEFDVEVDGVTTRSHFLLPMAGGEIVDWIESELQLLIALGTAERIRIATESWPQPFSKYGNYHRMYDISANEFDYNFNEFLDKSGNSPTNSLVPGASPYTYGTLNGVVVHGSKVTNLLWAVWGRAAGYTESELRYGAHLNQLLKSRTSDPESSQNGIRLASDIYQNYNTHGIRVVIEDVLTPERVLTIQDPSHYHDILWPSPFPVDPSYIHLGVDLLE